MSDTCFILRTSDTSTHRGCSSDDKTLDCNDSNCEKCNNNNCNDKAIIKNPTLKCIKCSETEECKYGYLDSDAEDCTNDVSFNEVEQCFTRTDTNGNIVRGCTLDEKTKCTETGVTCTTCSDGSCNKNNVERSNCVVCDTKSPTCADIPSETDLKPIDCTGLYAHYDRGCYTFKRDANVTRGCVHTLNQLDRRACDDSNDIRCLICLEPGCNNKQPNSAMSFKMMSFAMMIGIFILRKLLF